MGRGKNTFSFSGGFNINAQEPIDSRIVVASAADLTTASTYKADELYDGLAVSVKETGEMYILIDRANVTSIDSWKKVGDGKGAVDASNYTAACALATTNNRGQIIYVLEDEGTKGEEGYHAAGPYIVTGEGSISYIATSTGSGEDLSERVSTLETKVGDKSVSDQVKAGIEDIAEADASGADTGIYVEVKTKSGSVESVSVDASGLLKTADSSVFTKAEKDKLAAIEEEAQKNVIETVKVNGTALSVTDKAVDVTVTEGSANGTVAVNGSDVAVHGLGSAAYEDKSVFDASGAAHDVSVYVDTELAKKVNTADTSLFTKAEKDKLAGIAEGAEKNVLEGVKVDGVELTITDKKVDIKLPKYSGENAIAVSEVADNSAKVSLTLADGSILSQDSNGLRATLSIGYSDQKIQLKGIEGKLISEFDASMFVQDGMIEDASLVVDPEGMDKGTYIRIVFNTAAGKQPIYINVTSLIDVYTAGNGISIDGKAISVKIDAASESYLTASSDGLKLSGVDTAISNATKDLATKQEVKDLSTNIDSLLSSIDSSIARIDSSLSRMDASIADVSTRMDSLLAELSGSSFIKKVEVAEDSSDAIAASTDASGNVTLSVASALRNVITNFGNKLESSDITSGSADGTIAVKGSDVAVKGLKSAAYEDSSAFLAYNSMDWNVIE